MVGAHQNLNGSRDLTTLLSGMICHPWASTCCNQPVYQIWTLYLHPLWRYERRYKISKMGWFEIVRGYSRSLKIVPFDGAHTSSYLAFHSHYVAVLHCFWDVARYWSTIADCNLPHLCLALPLGVTPSEFLRDLWSQKTPWAIVGRCLHDTAFSHFGTVTDGQTDNHSIYRASIASRAKNGR